MADSQTCKRSDGRSWRCNRPVAEGKHYCIQHIQQAQLRRQRQPVPDHLKLHRTKQHTPKLDQEPSKRGKRVKLEMGIMEIGSEVDSVVELEQKVESPEVKVGGLVIAGFTRPIRTKNCEPIPISVVKSLPAIKENVKAAAKEKINKKKIVEQKKIVAQKKIVKQEKIFKQEKIVKQEKIIKTKKIRAKIVKKCHWCRLTSFCVLVKCLTCKKNFFCEECINKRCYCKKTVERECPVCQGECPCRACTKGKPKQVSTKELVIYDVDEDVIMCDPETEMAVSNREKMSDFEKNQQLRMIRQLLPVMSKMNQEKLIELDTEAQIKGTCHYGLKVPIAGYTEKECSFCKACIPDVHRSCDCCSFMLCLVCCHNIRDGLLHSMIENLKETKMIRSKRLKTKSWRFCLDGRLSCPPKNLGGCERGLLRLTSFYPLCLTKDLEENAKQILASESGLSDSSPCILCDEKEGSLYFSTKPDFKDNHLDHFINHWGQGKPMVIRDVLQTQPNLDWGFGFILCQYLKKSAESRNSTKIASTQNTRDWCEVEFRRKQIFSGGITHENVWDESLKFKLRFSSDFLEDHFPDHHDAIIRSLPLQECINPFTGFMNLEVMASYLSIFYGGSESDNPMEADLFSTLRIHAYDEINVLVYANARPIRETILNEVKMLMHKYNSQDHLKSSKKISNRNQLEGMFASTSRTDNELHSDVNVELTSSRLEDTASHEVDLLSDDSESESDDEDLSLGNSCGAHWDIFRREDVPKLLEYLRKYSDKLTRFHGSPKKVVHPLFDEVFYLDDTHKMRLKQEFNVDALSVEQHIGEAVIIPAGCPYQMRKTKSCVNMIYEFLSPESALESIKLSDEVRLLPVRHKAKGNMTQVKKTAISRMQEAIEAMREVFVSQPE